MHISRSHLPTSTTESKRIVSCKAKVVRGPPQFRWYLGILMLQYGTSELKITITTYPDSLPYMVAVTILLFYKLQIKKRSKRKEESKNT